MNIWKCVFHFFNLLPHQNFSWNDSVNYRKILATKREKTVLFEFVTFFSFFSHFFFPLFPNFFFFSFRQLHLFIIIFKLLHFYFVTRKFHRLHSIPFKKKWKRNSEKNRKNFLNRFFCFSLFFRGRVLF